MKQLLLTILMVCSSAILSSQTYQISFAAQGDASTVDEVVATNLTTNESITLPGGEVLSLQPVATNIKNMSVFKNAAIYSNMREGFSELHLTSQKNQEINIEVIAIDGRTVARHHQVLEMGNYKFKLAGKSQGIYIANISTGADQLGLKFCQSKAAENTIRFMGESDKIQELKSSNATYALSFSPDDHISYEIKSGDYITMIIECPAGDKTLTADMVECMDGDGNYYPVVKIGTQTWMAKNINTSKYMDGTEIPYIATTAEWGALPDANSGKGYGYFLEEEGDLYGAIYTYGAAVNGTPLSGSHIQGVCPNGWHIPSDAEWKVLCNYLGGTSYASNKLKSTRSDLWKYSPNGIGNNSSGFNALPSGYRTAYNGAPNLGGYYARWWSSNQYSGSWAYYCQLTYANNGVYLSYWEKSIGICVRCIKD
ncbi:fibrobacter succinogenes major paralogous domain-containing protein [Carboxylicivirga sp. N1Y90]|uniref:fibrobacter succinogenes major paralogous domain-containing protein n=1 Tax=Carboxylicivirga fragile TaxID=3417571 RepID=UPI003D33A8C5|nr:fibrobacter succinogenes major paralogous domain-containing protein [Marinilabiliaceae bacterium N1Y90]